MPQSQNAFQRELFDPFVREIGGEVLPESAAGSSADYLFQQEGIIAELKCLEKDQTENVNAKVEVFIEQWIRQYGERPSGSFEFGGKIALALSDAPKEIASKWCETLRGSIDGIIEKAHSQIRDTKLRLKLPDAKGIVLIFNEGNFLYTHVQDFWLLCGSVIEKRTNSGTRRFPDIHGMIYFSLETVPMRDQITGKPMSFWVPGQARTEASEYIRRFSDVLKERWYEFLTNRLHCKITPHSRTLSGNLL